MLATVLKRRNIETPRVPMPAESYQFLRDNRVPDDIIADLASSTFATWVSIGPLSLVPMTVLVEQNTYSIGACIENGYLAIAGGANGDPVVLNCGNRRMAFVALELLYGDDSRFEDCLHLTPFCYEEFWEALDIDEKFPWDYFEAKERWPSQSGPRLWLPGSE